MDGARESADVISDSVRDGEMRKWLAAQQHIIQPFKDLAGADGINSPELIDVYQEYFLELVRFFLAQGDLVADMRGMVATMKEKGKSYLPKPDLDIWKDSSATIAAIGCVEDEDLIALLRMVSFDAAGLEREYPRGTLEGGQEGARRVWIHRIIGALMVIALILVFLHYAPVIEVPWYVSATTTRLMGAFSWLVGSLVSLLKSGAALDLEGPLNAIKGIPQTAASIVQLDDLSELRDLTAQGLESNASVCEIWASARSGDRVQIELQGQDIALTDAAVRLGEKKDLLSLLNWAATWTSQKSGFGTLNIGSIYDTIGSTATQGATCLERSLLPYMTLLSSRFTGINSLATAEAEAETMATFARLKVITQAKLLSIYIGVATGAIMASTRMARRLWRIFRRGASSSSRQLMEYDRQNIFSLELYQDDWMPLRALREAFTASVWVIDTTRAVAFYSIVPAIMTYLYTGERYSSGSLFADTANIVMFFPHFIDLFVTQFVHWQMGLLGKYIGIPQTKIGMHVDGIVQKLLNYSTIQKERMYLEFAAIATERSIGPAVRRNVIEPLISIHESVRGYTKDKVRFETKMDDMFLIDAVNRIRDMATRSPVQTECLVLSPEGSGDLVHQVCKIVDDIGKLLGTEAPDSSVRDAVSSDDPCGDLCKIVGEINALLED